MLGNKKTRDKIDNARMCSMYYNNEMKNEWEFWEREFLNELGIIGSSKIITGGSDSRYNDYGTI